MLVEKMVPRILSTCETVHKFGEWDNSNTYTF